MDSSLELWLVELRRKLDEFDARMDQRWAALEQWGAAAEPHIVGGIEQSGATQIVVADNWGGLFEPAPVLGERVLSVDIKQFGATELVVPDSWGGLFDKVPVTDSDAVPVSAAASDASSAVVPDNWGGWVEQSGNLSAEVVFTEIISTGQIHIDIGLSSTDSEFASSAVHEEIESEENILQIQEREELLEVDEKVLPSIGVEVLKPVVSARVLDSLGQRPRDFLVGDFFVPRPPRLRPARREPLRRPPPRPPRPRRQQRAPQRPPRLRRPRRSPPRPPRLRPPWRVPPRAPRLLRRAPPRRRGRPPRRRRPQLRACVRPRTRRPQGAPRGRLHRRHLHLRMRVSLGKLDPRLKATLHQMATAAPCVGAALMGTSSAVLTRNKLLSDAARDYGFSITGDSRAVLCCGPAWTLPVLLPFAVVMPALSPSSAASCCAYDRLDLTDVELIGTDITQHAALGDHQALSITSAASLDTSFDPAATPADPGDPRCGALLCFKLGDPAASFLPKFRRGTSSTARPRPCPCPDRPDAAAGRALRISDVVLLVDPEALAEQATEEHCAKACKLVLAGRLPCLEDFVKDTESFIYTPTNCSMLGLGTGIAVLVSTRVVSAIPPSSPKSSCLGLLTPILAMPNVSSLQYQQHRIGEANLSTTIQIAQLALKNQQNRQLQQGVMVFVGISVIVEKILLEVIGKNLKNNVTLTVVFLGEFGGEWPEKLEAIVAAASGASGFEFGVDSNMDPELALKLHISLADERARQEAVAKQAREELSKSKSAGFPAAVWLPNWLCFQLLWKPPWQQFTDIECVDSGVLHTSIKFSGYTSQVARNGRGDSVDIGDLYTHEEKGFLVTLGLLLVVVQNRPPWPPPNQLEILDNGVHYEFNLQSWKDCIEALGMRLKWIGSTGRRKWVCFTHLMSLASVLGDYLQQRNLSAMSTLGHHLYYCNNLMLVLLCGRPSAAMELTRSPSFPSQWWICNVCEDSDGQI